jgi:NitT/TauT family transport system permease protein
VSSVDRDSTAEQVSTAPDGVVVGASDAAAPTPAPTAGLRWELFRYRARRWLLSPSPYLMLVGFTLFFGSWYLLVDVLQASRFASLPGLTEVVTEWTSKEPAYGISLFTGEYYSHIWASLRRVLLAFGVALAIGIPLGLFMGWSLRFREFTFPVFELLRPIPILAWVPLAILMFASDEAPVIYLTFLAAFFATTLNTMLGVQSVDRDLIRAAYCLGSKSKDVFRHVVIPGALPYIFTGLQIAMGVAWFSLVAGEMVAGRFGLGYLINSSYTTTRYPTIIIAMITLGFVGYITSALIRIVGNRLMAYRARAIAQ